MRLILDTNAYTALMRGHSDVVNRVRRAQELPFSPIVAGELLLGFRTGTRLEANVRDLDAFLANPYVRVVPVTVTTADRFARIATALRQRRTPIPTNDIWIAAQAMETGADLLSFDQHFSYVDGLVWIAPEA
jgi:tRNA(fMet)-specific endonuclease VapC